jgi:hypothetical protein
MKTLKFDGRLLYYSIIESECGEYGAFTCTETKFYRFKTEMVPKYCLFGKKVRKPRYEHLFSLYMNIESPIWTADDIRIKLTRELGTLKRQEEIANGKII